MLDYDDITSLASTDDAGFEDSMNMNVAFIEDQQSSTPNDTPTSPMSTSSASKDADTLATLPLSPLEQNAPRQYRRIAMALRWKREDSILSLQTIEIRECVTEAFFRTLQHWPFLAGEFRPSGSNPGQLRLVYPHTFGREVLKGRFEHQDALAQREMLPNHQLRIHVFGRERFLREVDHVLGDSFPPVTLKVTYIADRVVLGFAFSKVIFDGEFIHNFFRRFAGNTRAPGNCDPEGITSRSLPECGPGDDANLPLFKCRNAGEKPEPNYELVCRIIAFPFPTMTDLADLIRGSIQTSQVVLNAECIAALIWLAIVLVRHKLGRLLDEDVARMNISIPAALETRYPSSTRPNYFGNSTVTTIAMSHGEALLRVNRGAGEEGIPPTMHPRQLARAAEVISSAVSKVKREDLGDLVSLKHTLNLEAEQGAFDQAADRHIDSLCFEDWSWYGAEYSVNLLDTDYAQPEIFPCCDDMEEGQIILLPRKTQLIDGEDWKVCVCLEEKDMDHLLVRLNNEGWYDLDLETEPMCKIGNYKQGL